MIDTIEVEKEVFLSMLNRIDFLHKTISALYDKLRDRRLSEWLTTEQTCEFLHISERKLRLLKERGKNRIFAPRQIVAVQGLGCGRINNSWKGGCMKELVTANDPRIARFNAIADDITAKCQDLRECYHPLLGGKRFITDAQLAAKLGVSRRTTQDYRDKGYFPYYRIDGKILYAEDDIEQFLQSNYRPKFA